MHESSSGQPHRIFLGWKSPASPLVAQRILDLGLLDPEAPLYVVVPTKESSRQLKEQLAIIAAGSRGQGACLSPTIIPSNQLLGLSSQEMASPLEELFCWQQCLYAHQKNSASQAQQQLFLHSQDWKDQSWLYQAQQLCELFDVLAREGISLQDEKLQELGESEPRWQELLHLKNEQLNLLRSMGYSGLSDDAALPFPASARVVLACVPQLSRQLQGILSRSACQVQVWIHAPASYAKSFDRWGCPLESWLSPATARETGLSAANWQRQIRLCDDSFSMAEEAVTRLGYLNAQMGGKLHGLALCNADPSMESALEEALGTRGVIAHRPRGRSFLSSEWQHLLAQLADFNQKLSHARIDKKDWKHFPVAGLTQLLANPLFTALFWENGIPAYGEKSARILSLIQGRSFPTRLSGLSHELQNWSRHYPRQSDWLPAVMVLAASLKLLCGWLIKALESATSLTTCLLSLAKSQATQTNSPSGWKITEGLHHGFTESMIGLCTPLLRLLSAHGMTSMTVESCLAMMQLSMERARFTPMRDPQASMDIMGWRDLSYSAAERLVITAFHDSVIPERWGLDAWLTPSIRKQLSLRSDTEHAAHDAYLLRSILAPRPDKVSFFLSRVDRKKDPLSPSSLLFKICAREELPALVDYLFSEHESAPTALAAQDAPVGWRYRQLGNAGGISLERDSLAHARLADLGEENPIPADRGFSPSLLADFLACPLRFWLQRIFHLSTQEYEWDKKQLNAMDQGNIIHATMEAFIRRFPSYQDFTTAHPDFPELAASLGDEHLPAVEKILLEELATSYDQHFKLHPLIPQRLQYDGLKKRITSYAPIQLDLWKEGWETARDEQGALLLEYKPDWVWEGFRMNVTIDRVDCREGEAGLEMRVIDYKTGGVRSCADVHLSKQGEGEPSPTLISEELEEFYHVKGAKKKKLEKYRWTNLQLPIYAAWVEQHFAGATISAAYIRLSRKTEESGLLLWGEGETPAGLFDDHVAPLSEVGEGDIPDREQQLFSHAKQWALCCMRLIREGRCLVSAEQMGWEVKYERLFSSMNLQKPLHEIFLAAPTSPHTL